MVALLLEKARDLEIVVEVLNEQYSTPGETRAESSLSTRAFFYVSKIMNEEAKKKRTTWKTLKFPTGVSNQNYFSPMISIFFLFCFEMRFKYCLMTNQDPDDPFSYCRHRVERFCRTCRKLRVEDCPHDDVVGLWEKDQIKWKSGPKILDSDGIPTIRRQKRKLVTTPSFRTGSEPLDLPVVTNHFHFITLGLH